MDGKTILSWALRIFIAAMLIPGGFFKLTSAPEAVAVFAEIQNAGIPGANPGGRMLAGLMEIVGPILLLVPQLGRIALGAQITMAVMLGAVVSHQLWLEDDSMRPMAIGLLVAAAVVHYLQKD